MDTRYRLLWGALALVLISQIALLRPVSASSSEDATQRAVEWFEQKMAPDGALPGYENGYTVGGTADAILALAAAGEDPRRFGRKSGETPVEYLEARVADGSAENEPRDDAHLAGKVALAARVAGKDPERFGGVDLVRFIEDRYDPSSGGYRGGFKTAEVNPLGQSLSILGLVAAGELVPGKALDLLLSGQQPDGGWEFGAGFASDVQTSSMVAQALVAALHAPDEPRLNPVAKKAMAFFENEQNADGGFSYQKKLAANWCSGRRPSEVDSTGFAIQAIRAFGGNPDGPAWAQAKRHGPKDFLRTLQHGDGSFALQEGPGCPAGNGGSTYAAILGLEEASFPCLLELATCPPQTPSRAAPADGFPQVGAPLQLGAGVVIFVLAGWAAGQLLRGRSWGR